MNYCKKCVLPDTRPNLSLDSEGICSACRSSTTKKTINWAQREAAFAKLVQRVKDQNAEYDCVIPVSGGKDSIWQVRKCLEYGLHPLAITWKTPARTKLGQKNLDALIALGVDHIDFQVNPKVERRFIYETLNRFGSTAIPMHFSLFAVPTRLAVQMSIPLIVWGENAAFEYGTDDEAFTGFQLDSKYLSRFGVNHGTTAENWISDSLTRKDLTPYFFPNDSMLQKSQTNAVFLGYYFNWDPEITLAAAELAGFSRREEGPKTGFYNYADIDCDFISTHHYFKWLKFGFTRLFDNLSLEIRNGRVTRDEAVSIIKDYGSQRPEQDIQKLIKFLGISYEDYLAIEEKFRNKDLWKNEKGSWVLPNFIVSDFDWAKA